jgi:hypothetical protein
MHGAKIKIQESNIVTGTSGLELGAETAGSIQSGIDSTLVTLRFF